MEYSVERESPKLQMSAAFLRDKTMVMRAFNKLFFDFLDDVISIYPDNNIMRSARKSFETFKTMNPTSIIKVWYSHVYVPYKAEIDAGNMDFFIHREYSQDLAKGVDKPERILAMIDSIREPIANMGDANKEHAKKYTHHLSTLSVAYANAN